MPTVLDLSGRWTARRADQTETLAATVPGCIHHDLLRARKIPDPFYRDHEEHLGWIGEQGWVYRRTFRATAALLAHARVDLVAHGLDTFATVRVNGEELGHTDNMFRTWTWDLRSVLKPGDNEIEVEFDSVLPYIRAKAAKRPMPSWGGPREVRHRAYVRKEPCNFGWDWGPTLVTCGIWRPLEIVAWSGARLAEVHPRQKVTARRAVQSLDVSVQSLDGEPRTVRARLRRQGKVAAEREVAVGDGGKASLKLALANPDLWWPNGMGKQPLYDLEVELRGPDGAVEDAWTRRVGFRTVRLVQKRDGKGRTFHFEVNGQAFFTKGANWIPADAILSRMTPARTRDLLQSAADANMNLVRVWGGGLYPEDGFFDLCDELGLLVWQDFMFACSGYPAFDPEFLASVRHEAEDNVRRIRHHACLALWCGNNELEQGLVGPEWTGRQMAWSDYEKLFDDLLPSVVAAHAPDTDYIPSSAHTPGENRRKDAQDPESGDAHLWSVWHGRQPFEWYRTTRHRFVSEFGFQSFPEPKTTHGYTTPADRNITSYVMELHQRSGIGNDAIMTTMLQWFRMPRDFDQLLWMSQVLQSLGIKVAVEHWRRNQPRTMGSIYWQLNDCWPVASWSSIDFHGRWKALHYEARRFYAPLLVSGVEREADGVVEVHATNDTAAPVKAEVVWTLTRANGAPVAKGRKRLDLAPGNTRVADVDCADALARHGPRDLLVWLELRKGRTAVSRNLVHFRKPKHLELDAPELTWTAAPTGDHAYTVAVTARRPALWVRLGLASADARWSDNFFHLQAGETREILCHPDRKLTAAAFKKQVEVWSLTDSY